METDIYKYNMDTDKKLHKAIRRLTELNVKFCVTGTAIIVLAEQFSRGNISTVMTNLGKFSVKATDQDIQLIMGE
ncbi:MAG TPA: hypothetical protein VIC51_12905 [Psychromonas sp.]